MPKRKSDAIEYIEKGDTRKVKLLSHQIPVAEATNRTVACLGGNQSGKTLGVIFNMGRILLNNPGQTCYASAPTLRQFKSATLPKMEKVFASMDLYDPTDEDAHHKNDNILFMKNDAKLHYLATSDPETLQGVTTPGVLIDEVQEIDSARLYDIALERVAIMEGTVLLSGLVPHPGDLVGHWLYNRLYKPAKQESQIYKPGKGETPPEDDDSEHVLFIFSSDDNPFYPEERIQAARKELPEPVFRSEYKGEFIESLLKDNVFIPSSLDMAEERWVERMRWMPKKLYDFVANRLDAYNLRKSLPEHEEENISRAQGNYVLDDDAERGTEQYENQQIYKQKYNVKTKGEDDSDFEQKDPEAGIIKYDELKEHALPLLQGPEIDLSTIHIGVDVAGQGDDSTVAFVRWGHTILYITYWTGVVTTETEKSLGSLANQMRKLGYNVEMYVDAPGMGKGVIDHLRDEGLMVREYWPQKEPVTDRKRYANLKSWMHFKMRTKLLEGKEAFYPLSNLRSELMQSKYDYTAQDKITIVKPDESPDFCDGYTISGVPIYGEMSAEDSIRIL